MGVVPVTLTHGSPPVRAAVGGGGGARREAESTPWDEWLIFSAP